MTPRSVFVDALPFHVRPNNTDWLNLRQLGGIREYIPDWTFVYATGLAHGITQNGRYLVEVLQNRVPLARRLYAPNPFSGTLDARSLRRSGATLVYSHQRFPTNAGPVPVFWRNSVLDPQMQVARGATVAALDTEIALKRPLFRQAALIHVSTRAEVERLSAVYPECAEKFVAIPFFLQHLKDTASPEDVERKQRARPVELLFVGRHGLRKGLDLLLAAIESAGLANHPDFKVTVVSDLSDGPVQIPRWTNLTHHRSTPWQQTRALMSRSHLLAMPSRFESYGLTFVEAMAWGTIPIAPDWEVQREIVDGGAAGCVVPLVPRKMGEVLRSLFEDDSARVRLGIAALSRFRSDFAPAKVAARFADAFRLALARAHGSSR